MRAYAKLALTVLSRTLLQEGEQLQNVVVGPAVSCNVAQLVAKVAQRMAELTNNRVQHASLHLAAHHGRMSMSQPP
jgi:hypothetical protein